MLSSCPLVDMMQRAEDRFRYEMPGRSSRYFPNIRTWRSLTKTSMRPPTIVVGDEFISWSLQMVVTEYKPVIETFVTDGAYPALCDCIGLWSFHWSADLSDTKRCDAAIE